MSPAIAAPTTFAPVAANDNGPTDTVVDPWRCAIDGFKRIGVPSLAVFTAECRLRGELTFDEFAAMMQRAFEASQKSEAC